MLEPPDDLVFTELRYTGEVVRPTGREPDELRPIELRLVVERRMPDELELRVAVDRERLDEPRDTDRVPDDRRDGAAVDRRTPELRLRLALRPTLELRAVDRLELLRLT